MIRLASTLLVDDRGWVLLQERDEGAPWAPEKWGMPGGHVEEHESFEEAAYRELAEETGLELEPGHLYLWRETEYVRGEETLEWHVYVARLDGVRDQDVVVGEGRQIVFVDPEKALGLDLSAMVRPILAEFLDSTTYARLAGVHRAPGHRFSSVVLVDRRGRVLLQERDEHPEVDPEKWGFVGGGVEDGEDYEHAAHRELAEETGVRDQALELFGVFDVFHDNDRLWHEFSLWAGGSDLTDAGIVLGEGRQIVFLEPAEALRRDLTASAKVALASFLASDLYRRLAP